MIADIENKYSQGLLSVDSQPVTRGPYFKVGMALLCGSGLALLSIVTQSSSGTTSLPTSGTASTNLMGLSSVLRPSGGVVKPSIINTMGHPALPGSSPFKQIALAALEASNSPNRVRDVSMMAAFWKNADAGTKAAVEGMENAVVQKAKGMAGVTKPLNFFDPLGITATIPEGKLLFYREVEIKHGRVAMLASLGFLVGENFHPLFGGDIDVPSLVAFQATPLQYFWPAVVAALAIPEIFSIKEFEEPKNYLRWDESWTMPRDRVPGDLGFDPLGLKPKDAEKFKLMQTKEINNGRLAMMAAAGMVAQEVATGNKLLEGGTLLQQRLQSSCQWDDVTCAILNSVQSIS